MAKIASKLASQMRFALVTTSPFCEKVQPMLGAPPHGSKEELRNRANTLHDRIEFLLNRFGGLSTLTR
jgi:hypothetical protein